MKIGVCSPVDRVDHLENLGYDQLELTIGGIYELNDEEFAALKQRLADRKIKVKSANCMLHGSLPQAYLDTGLEKTRAYLATVMPRLKELGITIAVFGSGYHRRMPEDMPQEKRHEILSNLLTVIEEEARKNGITVAIEPLNRNESNILLSTQEAMGYIRELNLPNLKLLVDLYHFCYEGETLDRIYEYGPYIKHVHIVEPSRRTFLRAGDAYDYRAFVKALHDMGYDGALMFEGNGENYEEGIAESYPVLRTLVDEVRLIDTRCGLRCESCSYKAPCNCGGCIATNGHPFHGECPVAVCCQEKGFVHCGECEVFPCDLLQQYSCDPEHGDTPPGARIEQCRRWAAK